MNVFKKYLNIFAASIVLVIAVSMAGFFKMANAVEHQPLSKGANQCETSCPTLPAGSRLEDEADENEKQPQPFTTEPYYSQFMVVTFASVALSSVLLRHMRWRPPDLYKLTARFQI